MSFILLHDMSEYHKVLARVITDGSLRTSRGMETLDLGHTVIEVARPQLGGMPLGIGRRLNPAIGAIEALQLIAGFTDHELVIKLAPQFRAYADDNKFWGGYGDRIGLQMLNVERKLKEDFGTRQAVVTLWDPEKDNEQHKHDYPCTIALQFEMRGKALDMNTIMRSNDAWLGFPYDVFQFTQLQHTLAKALEVNVGIYRHTALSFHLYLRDIGKARQIVVANGASETHITETSRNFSSISQPKGVGSIGMTMFEMVVRATALIRNNTNTINSLTEHERWYLDHIHPA